MEIFWITYSIQEFITEKTLYVESFDQRNWNGKRYLFINESKWSSFKSKWWWIRCVIMIRMGKRTTHTLLWYEIVVDTIILIKKSDAVEDYRTIKNESWINCSMLYDSSVLFRTHNPTRILESWRVFLITVAHRFAHRKKCKCFCT